jgi:hypothetical protein
LTIAGAYFLGPVYGAALGAGIGGLIQGESLEQAFGSALTAGAGGALTAGIGGALGAGGTAGGATGFAQGVKQAFTTNPLDAVGRLAQGDFSGYYKNVAAPKPVAEGQSEISKFMFGEKPTQDMISEARTEAYKATAKDLAANAPKNLEPSALAKAQFEQGTAAANLAEANLQPSLLRQYGPSAALATTAAAAGGFFDAPEMEEMDDIKIGQDLVDENRGKYIVQGTDIRPSQPPFMVPTRFQFTPSPPVQYAADGGEAKEFPRRNGGIGMNEGTPGKDSVRAMLMPGEFVMTTDAVNGAGGGNNEKGIQNMYAMMRNFEAKARA